MGRCVLLAVVLVSAGCGSGLPPLPPELPSPRASTGNPSVDRAWDVVRRYEPEEAALVRRIWAVNIKPSENAVAYATRERGVSEIVIDPFELLVWGDPHETDVDPIESTLVHELEHVAQFDLSVLDSRQRGAYAAEDLYAFRLSRGKQAVAKAGRSSLSDSHSVVLSAEN